MRYSKKLFSVIAMALCLSFCMGGISHAKMLQYKETNYGYISGDSFTHFTCSFRIDGSGRLACNTPTPIGEGKYSFIKYNSKGKKTIRTLKFPGDEYGEHDDMMIYSNRAYWLDNEDYDIYVYAIKGKTIKKKPLKKIDVYYKTEKYLKNQADYPDFKLIGVGKNKVRLLCKGFNEKTSMYQCAVVDVNTVTGKVKKIAYYGKFGKLDLQLYYNGDPSYHYFEPLYYYDNENIYVYTSKNGKETFYRLSLKTKKTEKFTVDKMTRGGYSFYKGKIMTVCSSGEVYYGTFKSKKFKQIGTLNNCKKFKKYCVLDFVMKSSNEFYLVYATNAERADSMWEGSPYGGIFVCKYTCK